MLLTSTHNLSLRDYTIFHLSIGVFYLHFQVERDNALFWFPILCCTISPYFHWLTLLAKCEISECVLFQATIKLQLTDRLYSNTQAIICPTPHDDMTIYFDTFSSVLLMLMDITSADEGAVTNLTHTNLKHFCSLLLLKRVGTKTASNK